MTWTNYIEAKVSLKEIDKIEGVKKVYIRKTISI